MKHSIAISGEVYAWLIKEKNKAASEKGSFVSFDDIIRNKVMVE